jgi:hypothetical protein
MKCSREDFVIAWQQSTQVSDVVEKTGLTPLTVKKYAYRFRKEGVNLKSLEDERSQMGWEALRKLAEDSLPND